jgi:hypothetical protein
MLVVASAPRKLKQTTRFVRLTPPPDKIPQAFRVTERVLAILAALASHRFLSTDQIARLDGGSPRVVAHIMRLLHRHGFVDRPAAQAAYLSSFLHEGNVSLVHSITRKGMRLLADNGAPTDSRLDWTTKNSGNTALFLAHALEVSETMLAFRLAMPADQTLRLIDHNELLPSFSDAARESEFPYRLVVTVQQHRAPRWQTLERGARNRSRHRDLDPALKKALRQINVRQESLRLLPRMERRQACGELEFSKLPLPHHHNVRDPR